MFDYQSGLIDARAEGREEGEKIVIENGREEGQLIGRIQLLQELLDAPSLSRLELDSMTLEALTSTMQRLQAQLRERNA